MTKKAENAEETSKRAVKYGKRQLKEKFKPDVVEVLFNDTESVSLEDAEKRINKFYKTKL